MRNMGDMSWLNRYIGIPYEYGGRDAEGLDCYGLVKLIFKERYSVDLPDWLVDEVDLRGRSAHIADVVCGGKWYEMEEAADGDIAVCYRTKMAHHMGVFFAGGIIHCAEPRVVYQPRSMFEADYVKVVYGEWTP